MNLPNEVVELVIDHFLKSNEHCFLSYIIALNAVSLISPHYLERSRHIRFRSIEIDNHHVKIKHHIFSQPIEASHLLPRLRRTKSNPLTFNVAHYVKHLTLCGTKVSYRLFNKIFVKEYLVLKSFKIECSSRDPNEHISSLKLNRLSRIESFIIRSYYIFPDYLQSFVQTMQGKINSSFKLVIDCSINGGESDFALPVHALTAMLRKNSYISCFKPSFDTLKELDLTITSDLGNDVLISHFHQLQDLTIRCVSFDRESIIAISRIACTLKDIRKMSFKLIRTSQVSKSNPMSIDFFFEKQILIGIDALLHKLSMMDIELFMLVRELVDDTSYVAKKDVIEEIFGQTSDVDIRCFYKGAYIRRESIAEMLVPFFLWGINIRLLCAHFRP